MKKILYSTQFSDRIKLTIIFFSAKLKKQAEIDKKIKLATDNVQSPKKIDNVLQRSDVEMKDIDQENVNEIRKGISTLKLDDKGKKRKETSPLPQSDKKRKLKTPPPSQPSKFRSKQKQAPMEIDNQSSSPPPPTDKKKNIKTPQSQPTKQKRKEIPMEIDNGQSSSSVSSRRQKKQKIIPMEIDDEQSSLSLSCDNINSKSKKILQAAPPQAAAAKQQQQPPLSPPPRPASAPQLSTTSPKIMKKIDYSSFLKQFLSNIQSNRNFFEK